MERSFNEGILRLLTNAIEHSATDDEDEREVVESIRAFRQSLCHSTEIIDHATCPKAGGGRMDCRSLGLPRWTPIKELAAMWSVPERLGRILYQSARDIARSGVIEVGTCLGISSMYLAGGLRRAGKAVTFATLEGCPCIAKMARSHLNAMGYSDVIVELGIHATTLPDVLRRMAPFELAHVDGSHTYAEVISQHRELVRFANTDAILIYDDIRKSAGMWRAWSEMISVLEGVRAAIDLGRAGIIVLQSDYRGTPQQIDAAINDVMA